MAPEPEALDSADAAALSLPAPGMLEWNRDCACLSLDARRLRHALEVELGEPGLYELVRERNPHMFSALPVFVDETWLQRMREVAAALHATSRLPQWRQRVLRYAPPAARHAVAQPGLFLGLDFHLEAGELHLIEVNTNPGGALLSAALARAQHACCEAMRELLPGTAPAAAFEDEVLRMFLHEWQAAGRGGRPRLIAIVDEHPMQQYLYAEFRLYVRLFERAGLHARIADPRELRCEDGRLWLHGEPVDMVYNRLTDFALEGESQQALRQAWEQDLAVLTPHPRAHALLADKRNLALLCDAPQLRAMGLDEPAALLLQQHVPRTLLVGPDNAQAMWEQRRDWFFKPWGGFGARAAYRGAKLTRAVWEHIRGGGFVAQRLQPPGLRHVGAEQPPLKFDLRAYAYEGRVQWFSARLYQGQTTNFRTPGGGFAPVLSVPHGRSEGTLSPLGGSREARGGPST